MDTSNEFHDQVQLVTKISSHFNALTKAEKKVADYVLANMELTIYMTVTELAEHIGVGETTVLRFCRKIGFKGYQSFKMAITKEVATLPHDVFDESDAGELDETQYIIQKTMTNNIQALKETASLIDVQELEKAIQFILAHKRVVFYGVGVSGNTAIDARNKMMRIGVITEMFIDSHIQAMSAATLTDEDVAIGISVTGSTKDTVDALKIAKENGAKIVSITQFTRSPITKISDVVLLTGGRETALQGGSMSAKIAQLFVIDMLCNGVASRLKDKALKYKEVTANAVAEKAY
ncbi:MurR/RpiR family transcriptional regulator [Bacillus sp. FJAT-50079]|uniref:MurR/RpiR family transcriptional regulator n=1 Tax=Bacillus sp. FJAT-50079 TaxID=2833577 RepID=UPI001BC91EAF|nr:MurR/RpiR family transcriptional regulator [Bacillus sp. FJAT-50079]MBS4209978.1 MurR/RpiR family transcriptional regulator [Bacillus sp. FJAT-50079]